MGLYCTFLLYAVSCFKYIVFCGISTIIFNELFYNIDLMIWNLTTVLFVMMNIENFFLFGAGASFGCGGTNKVVPLGSDLFIDLKKRFPKTWGSLSAVYDNDFKEFERIMDRLWEDPKYVYEISNFLQDMGIFFSKFKIINQENNLYHKLFNGIKNKDLLKKTVLSTITNDCLV